jgi:hypothetical protein
MKTMHAFVRTALVFLALVMVLGPHASAVELERVASTDPNVETFRISGTVVPGDGLKFRGFVGALPQGRQLVAELAFTGAMPEEQLSIARFIAEARIRTVVPRDQTCGGGCILALLAGRDRATNAPSYLKFSSARLMATGSTRQFDDRQFSFDEFARVSATSQKQIMETQAFLASVNARPGALQQYLSVLPGDRPREISNDVVLSIGIPVFDEAQNAVVQPLPAQR